MVTYLYTNCLFGSKQRCQLVITKCTRCFFKLVLSNIENLNGDLQMLTFLTCRESIEATILFYFNLIACNSSWMNINIHSEITFNFRFETGYGLERTIWIAFKRVWWAAHLNTLSRLKNVFITTVLASLP